MSVDKVMAIVSIVVIGALGIAGLVFFMTVPMASIPGEEPISIEQDAASDTPSVVACTMEAMLCPDGETYVGRTGPNCEFEACPAVDTTEAVTPLFGQGLFTTVVPLVAFELDGEVVVMDTDLVLGQNETEPARLFITDNTCVRITADIEDFTPDSFFSYSIESVVLEDAYTVFDVFDRDTPPTSVSCDDRLAELDPVIRTLVDSKNWTYSYEEDADGILVEFMSQDISEENTLRFYEPTLLAG